MKKLIFTIAAVLATISAGAQNPYAQYTVGLPFAMAEVKAPLIPKNEVRITDFGAVGDGQTLCTRAFVEAIDALAARGGGRLLVPRGIWHTGPIVLKSHIDLHLEKGAVILFAADERLYPLVKTSFEGLDTYRCQSPLSAIGASNIAITGHGVIDGNGQYWRPLKKAKVTEAQWREMTSNPDGVETKKGYWVPSKGYAKGEASSDMNVPQGMKSEADWESVKRFLRPVMVSLVECRNVLL